MMTTPANNLLLAVGEIGSALSHVKRAAPLFTTEQEQQDYDDALVSVRVAYAVVYGLLNQTTGKDVTKQF